MRIIYLFLWLFGAMAFAQPVSNDSLKLHCPEVLDGFFAKLASLERGDSVHVNIVHIGDSHIQADLLTGALRQKFHARFGDAGRGFVFPYRMAGTNGPSDYTFSTDVTWKSHRNIHTPAGHQLGLSGIGLRTADKMPVLHFRHKSGGTSLVRWIGSQQPSMGVVPSDQFKAPSPRTVQTHRIRSGETLSGIAQKYGIGLSELKRLNGLKSARIQAGKTLKIASAPPVAKPEIALALPWTKDSLGFFVRFDSIVQQISLVGSAQQTVFYGLNLQSDQKGVRYHSIGVNGAKLSDYLKYDAFFEQIPALEPDLVVISLGTNESFDRWDAQIYAEQLETFIDAVRSRIPNVALLVKTPPFSQFRGRNANPFLSAYAAKILENAGRWNVAAADNLNWIERSGNAGELVSAGYLGTDRIHYTKSGYHWQADLFFEALMNEFEQFKNKGDD